MIPHNMQAAISCNCCSQDLEALVRGQSLRVGSARGEEGATSPGGAFRKQKQAPHDGNGNHRGASPDSVDLAESGQSAFSFPSSDFMEVSQPAPYLLSGVSKNMDPLAASSFMDFLPACKAKVHLSSFIGFTVTDPLDADSGIKEPEQEPGLLQEPFHNTVLIAEDLVASAEMKTNKLLTNCENSVGSAAMKAEHPIAEDLVDSVVMKAEDLVAEASIGSCGECELNAVTAVTQTIESSDESSAVLKKDELSNNMHAAEATSYPSNDGSSAVMVLKTNEFSINVHAADKTGYPSNDENVEPPKDYPKTKTGSSAGETCSETKTRFSKDEDDIPPSNPSRKILSTSATRDALGFDILRNSNQARGPSGRSSSGRTSSGRRAGRIKTADIIPQSLRDCIDEPLPSSKGSAAKIKKNDCKYPQKAVAKGVLRSRGSTEEVCAGPRSMAKQKSKRAKENDDATKQWRSSVLMVAQAADDADPTRETWKSCNPGLRSWWNTIDLGNLWILHEGRMTEEESQCLSNWKRRFFVVQIHSDSIILAYHGRADASLRQMSCIFKGQRSLAEVEIMPAIHMSPATLDMQTECAIQLAEYETARRSREVPFKPDLFESQVPKKLYPFHVTWLDTDGNTRENVFATALSPAHAQLLATRLGQFFRRASAHEATCCFAYLSSFRQTFLGSAL